MARSLSRESISANSTSPTAARRSAAVSAFPASWRSYNSFSRRCTPAGSRKCFSSPPSGSSKWTGSAIGHNRAPNSPLQQAPPSHRRHPWRRPNVAENKCPRSASLQKAPTFPLPSDPWRRSQSRVIKIATFPPLRADSVGGPSSRFKAVQLYPRPWTQGPPQNVQSPPEGRGLLYTNS